MKQFFFAQLGYHCISIVPEYFPYNVGTAVKINIVGMSALLTTTMGEFKKNIEIFKKLGLRDQVKIIIGGAPVSEKYAMESGADAYGEDAVDAVEKAKKLISLK